MTDTLKITAAIGAMLVGLSGGAAYAAPADDIQALKSTVEELRKQLKELKGNQQGAVNSLDKARFDELRVQLDELRSRINERDNAAKKAAADEGAQTESAEAIAAKTPASQADIQGLRTDLENYKYDNARQLERNVPSVTRNTKIGGTLTVQYATQEPGVQPTTAAGTNLQGLPRDSGFAAPAVGLNFTGTLYRDYEQGKNFTYRAAFSTATNVGSNAAAYNTTGQASTNGSQFNLTDAYVRYSYEPVSGNAEDRLGTVTLGQQVVPFGQDAQALDPEVRPVINSAAYVGGLGFSARQVGVVVAGDIEPYVDYTNSYRAPLLTYAFGLVNGNGSNKAANNSSQDIAARLVYTLPVDYSSWFRQLQLGASWYRGSLDIGGSAPAAGAAANNTVYSATETGHNDRSGLDLNWTHLPYSVSYEYVSGKSPVAAKDYTESVDQYINFGYTWGEQFLNSSKSTGKFDDWWPKSYQLFLRIDAWDPNTNFLTSARSSNSTRKQEISTLGLNFFFAETSKFQINYIHTHYFQDAGTVTAGAGSSSALLNPQDTDALLAQFSVTF